MVKIGRNAPCPCGSGKKYKRCCLHRTIMSFPETATESYGLINEIDSPFEYINDAAGKISVILSKYNVEDITKAVFCINAWRPNRSALAQCYAINKALIMCKNYGNRRLVNYKDFENFFQSIARYSVMSNLDDNIIDDFGEIFINYKGRSYPVITGTGHIHVYPSIRFIPYLCNKLGKEEEFTSILSYLEIIISTLGANNNIHKDRIVYEIPSEEFWHSVNLLYERVDFKKYAKLVYTISQSFSNRIESAYGFEYLNNVYPLWNPGLLVDFYHSMNPDETKYPKESLLCLINNMYCMFDSVHMPIVLLEPVIVNRTTKAIDNSNGILFVLIEGNDALVFVENNGTTDVEKRIKKLEEKHREQTIDFVEGFRRAQTEGNRGCSIASEQKIHFIGVHAYTDVEIPFYLAQTREDHSYCTYLDILCLFGFSQIKEVIEFFSYKENKDYQLFTFGSTSNEFFLWKTMQHHFSRGAIDPSFINIDYNETELFIYDYFKNILSDFPHNNEEYFTDPLEWDFFNKILGYSVVCRKDQLYLSGFLKKYHDDFVVFIANSYQFFKRDSTFQMLDVAHKTLTELTQRLFNRYAAELSTFELLHGKVLHLLFVPEEEYSNFPNKTQCSIINYSISFGHTIISIRYTINIKALFNYLQLTKDRSYENRLFLDFMHPFQAKYPEQYMKLSKFVNNDNNKKKTVSANEMEQRYVFSPFSAEEEISESSYIQVRKEMASICMSSGILPGEYHGKKATEVIRTIQLELVKHFENTISSYNKMELHYMALKYYSHELNGIYMQKERIMNFRDLDDEIQQEFFTKTIESRENSRRNKYTAEYLIESNLFIDHNASSFHINEVEFNYLLAFADWLCTLQEISDICYQRTDDSFITVDDQFVIDTHRENEAIEDIYKHAVNRKYRINEYGLKLDQEDQKYIQRIKDAFILDTGVNFELLLSLLEYISLDLILDTGAKETNTNVYSFSRRAIIDGFINKFDVDMITDEAVEKALDFIILNTSLLKTYGGNQNADILPTWEREARENRFEVKPIIVNRESYVFSPVAVYQTLDLWRNGLLNWIPPYETGLTCVKAVLKEWKKRYEDLMVQDIKKLFDDVHFDQTIPEVELSSRFPQEDFPKELGDYDVISINEEKAEIWLIESKVFHKVGSIFEDLMLQKSVFVQHKYDERFQRRINYIRDNIDRIIKVFGLSGTNYRIIPYMVTNKIFYSRYKPLSFEIISFSELQSILINGYGFEPERNT